MYAGLMNKVENILIFGKHPVREALLYRSEVVKRVYLTEEARGGEIEELARKVGLPPTGFEMGKPPRGVLPPEVHQGALAEIDISLLVLDYGDWIAELNVTEETAVVVLGEVQDPHNVGAVIRSAGAFGIAAVLIPEHNQAPISSAVAKVSAGMVFRVPIVSITNVNEALRDLKDRRFWVYGLAGDGANDLYREKFDAPAVFVLGGEHHGVREKTRETCDIMLRIPMHERAESLNVAVSAGIVFSRWASEHRGAIL